MTQNLLHFVSLVPLFVFALHASTVEAVRSSPDHRYILKVSVEPDGNSARHTVHRRLFWMNRLVLSHTTRGVEDDTYGQNESLTASHLSFTIHARSLDWRRGVRTIEFHYKLRGPVAQRIGPLANNAVDFVEEWIAAPWTLAQKFTRALNAQRWHSKLSNYPRGAIDAIHTVRKRVWEVVIRFERRVDVAFRVARTTRFAITQVRLIRR